MCVDRRDQHIDTPVNGPAFRSRVGRQGSVRTITGCPDTVRWQRVVGNQINLYHLGPLLGKRLVRLCRAGAFRMAFGGIGMALDGNGRLTKCLDGLLHFAEQDIVFRGQGGLSRRKLNASHANDQLAALFVDFCFVRPEIALHLIKLLIEFAFGESFCLASSCSRE